MPLSNMAQEVFMAMGDQLASSADDLKSKAGLEQEQFRAVMQELVAEGLLKQADPSNFGAPTGTVYFELTTMGFMSIPG